MERITRFTAPYSDQIMAFLSEINISSHRSEEFMREHGYDYVSFTISDHHMDYQKVISFMAQIQKKTVITHIRYSQQELDQAEWLCCAATSGKIDLKRVEDTFEFSEWISDNKVYHKRLCGKPFYVSKPVRHSRLQHFFYAYEASMFNLFCTEYARKMLQSIGVPVKFEKVLHYRTEKAADDLYYIDSSPLGPAFSDAYVRTTEEFACPLCGRKTIFPPFQVAPFVMKRNMLEKQSLWCKTPGIFSSGGNLEFSLELISQSVYKFLKANQLDRGLLFEPVFIDS